MPIQEWACVGCPNFIEEPKMSGTFLCYVVLYIMIKSVLKYICLIVIKNFGFQFIFYFFEIVLPYYLYFY